MLGGNSRNLSRDLKGFLLVLVIHTDIGFDFILL